MENCLRAWKCREAAPRAWHCHWQHARQVSCSARQGERDRTADAPAPPRIGQPRRQIQARYKTDALPELERPDRTGLSSSELLREVRFVRYKPPCMQRAHLRQHIKYSTYVCVFSSDQNRVYKRLEFQLLGRGLDGSAADSSIIASPQGCPRSLQPETYP